MGPDYNDSSIDMEISWKFFFRGFLGSFISSSLFEKHVVRILYTEGREVRDHSCGGQVFHSLCDVLRYAITFKWRSSSSGR